MHHMVCGEILRHSQHSSCHIPHRYMLHSYLELHEWHQRASSRFHTIHSRIGRFHCIRHIRRYRLGDNYLVIPCFRDRIHSMRIGVLGGYDGHHTSNLRSHRQLGQCSSYMMDDMIVYILFRLHIRVDRWSDS